MEEIQLTIEPEKLAQALQDINIAVDSLRRIITECHAQSIGSGEKSAEENGSIDLTRIWWNWADPDTQSKRTATNEDDWGYAFINDTNGNIRLEVKTLLEAIHQSKQGKIVVDGWVIDISGPRGNLLRRQRKKSQPWSRGTYT